MYRSHSVRYWNTCSSRRSGRRCHSLYLCSGSSSGLAATGRHELRTEDLSVDRFGLWFNAEWFDCCAERLRPDSHVAVRLRLVGVRVSFAKYFMHKSLCVHFTFSYRSSSVRLPCMRPLYVWKISVTCLSSCFQS